MSIRRKVAATALSAAILTLIATNAARAAELTVLVEGAVSSEGVVKAALFDKNSGFPRGKFLVGQTLPASKGVQTFVFKDVEPGAYAISAYHDVNENGRLDSNMLGVPSEAYGFSRDARGVMGPPKWDDAMFAVDTTPVNLTVRLK